MKILDENSEAQTGTNLDWLMSLQRIVHVTNCPAMNCPSTLMPDGNTIEWALACLVNCHSQFYIVRTLSIEEQAQIIARSYGINGSNFQYLHNTLYACRKFSLLDTFTKEMKQLYGTALLYRHRLVEQERQWLDTLDKLSTKDERQLAIKSRKTKRIGIKSRKLLNRMCSVAPTTIPTYHRMLSA
ncbi:unnamed protein product [Rotaria sp. Silwood2]|nr:unnamed protein product [Rotaria sp. Silwood2]CAF4310465.1 unnamed protein product [Rotaria sp. Silwood2]CAF4387206.1 unnamed protein product [Rotaria sp. Silwood2]